jgi:hypothetical protein
MLRSNKKCADKPDRKRIIDGEKHEKDQRKEEEV